MKASSSQQRWNAGTIPVTHSSKPATSSWWTAPITRAEFMAKAQQEHQSRMRFATVTGITRNPIGYWPNRASVDA